MTPRACTARPLIALVLLTLSAVLVRAQTIDQDFLRAVEDRDFAKVESLLIKGAILLAATTNFALHRAVVSRNLNEVKMQLEAGADVNTRSDNGYTPLVLAVEYDYSGASIVNYLLEKGANPNLPDQSGNTPLMIAAGRNNRDAATALLAHKASVYLRNQQRRTALHVAAFNADLVESRIVDSLLKAGAKE